MSGKTVRSMFAAALLALVLLVNNAPTVAIVLPAQAANSAATLAMEYGTTAS